MDGDVGKEADANKQQRVESAATMNLERGVVAGNGNTSRRKPPIGIVQLFLACMVAGGLQYGSALQLSLLSPYSQTLGISHSYVSLTWICGPISGFVMLPITGYYSDRCTSKMGRRRPFILAGCIIICLSLDSTAPTLARPSSPCGWLSAACLDICPAPTPNGTSGSLGSKPRRAAMPVPTSKAPS